WSVRKVRGRCAPPASRRLRSGPKNCPNGCGRPPKGGFAPIRASSPNRAGWTGSSWPAGARFRAAGALSAPLSHCAPRNDESGGGRSIWTRPSGLRLFRKAFAQFHQLGRDRRQAIRVPLAFAFPVFLMISFRRIPSLGAFDGGQGGAVVPGVPARDCGFGFGALGAVQGKDGAAVLRADVVALAVELGRIVRAQQDIENPGIGNDGRIVSDLDGLCMARL